MMGIILNVLAVIGGLAVIFTVGVLIAILIGYSCDDDLEGY